ncbi:MAG: EsaB/YukD family protein [Catenulispora sp.]
MTAGSGAARPGAVSGHCRVTVVTPTRRVDVALPEDVPLAELLPELLRLIGDPVPAPAGGAATLNGYVLTGADGTALDTSAALAEQGVLDGGVLRLRSADDVPEAAVHDDIADAVAEAVLAGGTQWSTTALRATALTVAAVAATLGAVVLWSSGTGTFHGWRGVIAGVAATLLCGLAVWRARYDVTAVGRGSYYGYGGLERSPAAARLGNAVRGRGFESHSLPGDGPGYGYQHHDPRYGAEYRAPDHRDPGHGFEPRRDPADAPGYDHQQRDPRFQPRFGRRRFWRGRAAYAYPSGPDFAAPSATFDLASFAPDQIPGARDSAPRTVSATTLAHATNQVRTGGLGSLAAWPTVAEAMAWATGAHHKRDYTAASVLAASSLPYAFIAGVGVLPADPTAGHGLGRVHFTAGAIAVLLLSLAAILGLGRRTAVPVAGATVGLIATLTGIGLQLTQASPASGIAVVAAGCALAVELLPFAALVAARFVIEPPTSGVEPGDFDGSPVNNYAVGLRVARTLDTLTGLTAGLGTLLVLCVVLLVVPIDALQTAPQGPHTVWEQALAFLASGVVLCRARLFRERAQVLATAVSGLTGLVVAFGAMAWNAEPDVRALWLAPLLLVLALLALGLASIRPRRGTSEPILPPRWSRMIDLVEGAVFLAVLPVLMAVLGVYGQVRNFKG